MCTPVVRVPREKGRNMSAGLILIVEDHPRNLQLIRDVLQFRGYTTLEADTAEAGMPLA